MASAVAEAHMAHPLATKAISAGRVKNDSVDARTLAHLLRTHLLPEARIAPPEVREARRLVRMRASLERIRSRLKCQVHAVLAEHGVALPDVADLFGKEGRAFLGGHELPAISQRRVQANLRLIDELTREVAAANDEMRTLFAPDPRLRRLLPIPGIGPLIAATVLVEVGDVSRFASVDRLCSWAGLTPTERTSDVHTHRGHISKQGSRWLRWAMVEAARRGKKIARVALARRILTLCFYALRDERGCRAYPARSRTVVEARSPSVMASRTPRRPRH